ncbi:hypothetical protein [Agrobacterium tumefaciens]|uniref:hypothetical protein n=1 Tax=Agrobacterium tumefaciens TaxID=358 RepID=UPI001573D795|nr:hypothetical protein [Agrobacterium tumefaciens]
MLTVFTSADTKYEPFVLPYIASVLLHNKETHVEIVLEDAAAFRKKYAKAIKVLEKYFTAATFTLRDGDFSKAGSHAIRFLETPSKLSEFVYIGDIDILILQAITPAHLKHMNATGLNYSNIIRKEDPPRLTGLHFTRYDAYYPLADVEMPEGPGWDEVLLTKQVQAKGNELQLSDQWSRPLHGFHISLRRLPFGSPNWGLEPHFIGAYKNFTSHGVWVDLYPLLDPRYHRVSALLDTALIGRFPDEMAGWEGPTKKSISLW